jgi:hypothetical protein
MFNEKHYIPVQVSHSMALPELRQQMVKILAEHDGSEKIDKMQAIPERATRGFSKSKFLLNYFFTLTHRSEDAPKQQEQQPSVKQNQVTDMKADDDEDCPGCT